MNVTIFNDVRKIRGDGGGIVLQNVLAPGIRSLVRKVVVRKKTLTTFLRLQRNVKYVASGKYNEWS